MKVRGIIVWALIAAGCGILPPVPVEPPAPVVETGPVTPAPACDKRAVINTAYRELLDREPDPFGLEYYGSRLCAGEMDEASFRAHVRASDEYARLHPPEPATSGPWDRLTDAEMRRWCGAIATTLWSGPHGIRPGRADNPIFTAEYLSPVYSPSDRARMLAEYPYRHWALNPLVAKGYAGYWPDIDYRSNLAEYQRRVDEIYAAGKIPVPFLIDDTGVWGDGQRLNREAITREIEPILRGAWFQSRYRVVALAWEPDYLSDDWQWLVQWARRVLPNARLYVHFPSGHGAPGRGSELARRYPKDHPQAGELMPGEPNAERPYLSEAEMWGGIPDASRPGGARPSVARFIDGFLQQDTYSFLGETDEGRTPEQQVLYDAWDFIRRFRDGFQGWPTKGWRGEPLDMVMFEYGSYALFHGGPGRFGTFSAAAAASVAMGDQLARVEGIAGFGDGGPSCHGGQR